MRKRKNIVVRGMHWHSLFIMIGKCLFYVSFIIILLPPPFPMLFFLFPIIWCLRILTADLWLNFFLAGISSINSSSTVMINNLLPDCYATKIFIINIKKGIDTYGTLWFIVVITRLEAGCDEDSEGNFKNHRCQYMDTSLL